MPPSPPTPDEPDAVMQCMEVWGGNEPVDCDVVMPGLDAWVYCEPFEHARRGGDVYFASSCDTGRISRLLVADVSGHGAAVSETAITLRSLMRRFVNQLDQGRFIQAMNHEFISLSKEGRFATAIAATYFAPTSTLTLTNAGHPPAMLYRADVNQWFFLQKQDHGNRGPANVPLGILDISDYDQRSIHLQPGDMVLCYTDSLIECRDKHGSFLDKEGLAKILNQMNVNSPKSLIPDLLKVLGALSPNNLTEDDVTLLLFMPNERRAEMTIVRRMLIPFRMMKHLVRSFLPGGRPMPWPDLNLANIGGAMFSPFNRLWGRNIRD